LRWLQRFIDERLPPLTEVALAASALARLRAAAPMLASPRVGEYGPLDVGPTDAIGVGDGGNGRAEPHGSVKRPAFDWYGDAAEILERLRDLPDGGGPEAIRSEFA